MKEEEIVIVSAARTPVGSFNGALSSLPAHALGQVAIKAALERAKVDPADVDEVIMGQVLPAGQGMNPARQAAMAAGVPIDATAFGINQVCGSGPAGGRPRRPADRDRRCRHRGRRRSGKHEPSRLMSPICATGRRWATWSWSTA